MSLTDPRVEGTKRLRAVLLAALVAVCGFVAYWPALSARFVNLDDVHLLVDNDRYRGLSWAHLEWMFTTRLLGHYQPLTWLSYAVDYSIRGLWAPQFHLTSLLLHAANGVLVFLIFRRVLSIGSPARGWVLDTGAVAGALFWAVHPLRVESAAWVTERRDVLSAFFLLLSTLIYLRSATPGEARMGSWRAYAVALGLLAVSLLAKSWGMTLFVTLLLLDTWPLRRLPLEPWRWFDAHGRPVLVQKVPFALVGLPFALIAAGAQRSASAVRTLEEWPLTSRIAQAAYGLVFYVWKSVSPTDLSPRVELPPPLNPLAIEFVACYALLAAAALGMWLLRRRAPGLLVAVATYVVTVSPVLGLFQSGDQLVADRYSYLAVIPLAGVLAAGVALAARRLAKGPDERHVRKGPPRAVALAGLTIAALWIAAMFWMTPLQTLVWRDPESLWVHTVRVRPESAMARVTLANTLEEMGGRRDEAIWHCREALAHNPRLGRGWYLLGTMLRKSGDTAGAEAAYRQAIIHMPQKFTAYVNLGSVIEPDRPEEALRCFEMAIEDMNTAPPGKAVGLPYLRLGMALERKGDAAGAHAAYTRALAYPDSAPDARAALNKLGSPMP